MGFTIKKVIFISLFCLPFSSLSFAATIKYEIKKDSVDFLLTFQNPPANVKMLKGDRDIVFNFDSAEPIEFKLDFFDLPIKSATVTGDGTYRKKFIVTFEKSIIEPKVNPGGKTLLISFPIAAEILNPNTNSDNLSVETAKPALPGMGAYFRTIFALIMVLAIILVLYKLLKSYLKKQVFSDIPGSGRLLGKVDLDIRKSLYFYEIGDSVYIIGSTDTSITLIDKVSDDGEITNIKSGLAKKYEFTGYMSFFGKKAKAGLNEEMSVGNALVEEKIQSLRRK